MPACDTCRKRKIRCDRESPCGACRSSNFECSTAVIRPRAARRADLTSKQNQRLLTSLKPKGEDMNVSYGLEQSPSPHLNTPKSTSDWLSIRPNFSQSHSVSSDASESAGFEGETSLHAHSIVAQDHLVQTLDDHSRVRDSPQMVVALNYLRQLVETDQVKASQRSLELKGSDRSRQAIYELNLPPSTIISDVSRKSRERTMYVFDSPLAFVTSEQFNKHCKTVFFRTEDYPTSIAVIVHGTLENLLQEFRWAEKDPSMRQQYNELEQLCRTNLEICISNIDLLLPATMEGAQAITIAASYCIQTGRVSTGKKLVTHGYMLMQSLGWHRATSMKNDGEIIRHQKLVMFWMLYIIDNNLSLRLGQASLIQEYDIDLPLPWLDPSAPLASLKRINLWAKGARVMGLIYQRLYSPGALKQTNKLRLDAVQQLLAQVESIRPKPVEQQDVSQFVRRSDTPIQKYHYDAIEVVYRSDEVTYHSLLCMIYRATPINVDTVFDPVVECVKHARSALSCHQQCTVAFKKRADLWAMYLYWCVLNTPFVAFTTLFSHVLATHDHSDLKLLRQFADSMSDCPAGQAAHKISKLASVFVTIATLYVESKEQDSLGVSSTLTALNLEEQLGDNINPSTMADSMSTTMPFSPFLDALGFMDVPSLNAGGILDVNMNLENWFNGNQHLLSLVENDLSYLDPNNLIL